MIVVEVMGRYAGWIALQRRRRVGRARDPHPRDPVRARAGGGEIAQREQRGAKFSIVVVAEGATPGRRRAVGRSASRRPGRALGGIGAQVAAELEELTGKEARTVVLGHLLRGGSPTSFDRLLGLRFGAAAVRALEEGHDGVMVALNPPTRRLRAARARRPAGMKTVPLDCDTMLTARDIGINFGDRMP